MEEITLFNLNGYQLDLILDENGSKSFDVLNTREGYPRVTWTGTADGTHPNFEVLSVLHAAPERNNAQLAAEEYREAIEFVNAAESIIKLVHDSEVFDFSDSLREEKQNALDNFVEHRVLVQL